MKRSIITSARKTYAKGTRASTIATKILNLKVNKDKLNYLDDTDFNSVESQERPPIRSKHTHHNSLSNCPDEVEKPVISVSKNLNNIKMIPAPVFQPKEENKFENGTYCSSDSSSAATLGTKYCFMFSVQQTVDFFDRLK